MVRSSSRRPTAWARPCRELDQRQCAGMECRRLAANSCCGHILITEKTSSSLIEGTALTNTASITTTVVESNTTNNTASAVSIVCEMAGSVKQVHAGEVMPGDVLTYTIVINRARRSVGRWTARPCTWG